MEKLNSLIKAAEQGDAQVMYELAKHYSENDLDRAEHWASEAVEAGQTDALKLLEEIVDKRLTVTFDAFEDERTNCLNLIDEILGISHMARKDGLLILGNYTPEANETIMKIGIILLSDGVGVETVEATLKAYIDSLELTEIEQLRHSIIMKGLIAIQAGEISNNIKEELHALLGEDFARFADENDEGSLLDTEVENHA